MLGKYNPCVEGRPAWTAPIGDFLASLVPECPCCAAIRGIVVATATGLVGLVVGALVW
jgi:hypothetical protein